MPRNFACWFVALTLFTTPALAQTASENQAPAASAMGAMDSTSTPGTADSPGSAGTAVTAETPTPAGNGGASIPSWGSLFTNLGGDLKNLASLESAVILGVGGSVSWGVHHQDVPLTQRASGSQTLDTVFESGAVLGGGLPQIGGAFATYAFGRGTNHPRVAVLGADLFRAQMVSTVLTQGIKLVADRPRPDGGRFSFPSGHTSGTFATAAVLQRHFGWKVGVPAYGFASWVAGSRLQGNKHFLSDVVFGAAIGVVSGRAVTVGKGQARFGVTPIATHGGGGIGFTLLGAQ